MPKVDLREINKNNSFLVGDTKVRPIEVMHGQLPIMGFRIGNFAYITDIKTIEDDQLSLLNGLDILVLSALQQREHYSHLSLEEALELSRKIGAKSTFFTHLSHTMGSTAETEKLLPPNVFIAYDELVLELPDPLTEVPII